MKYHHFLKIAAKEALKSNCKYQLGCLAISRNQVVAKGFNRYSSYPVEGAVRKGEHTIHAEQICLNRIGRNNIDALFVVRLGADGFTMAAPCRRCMAYIKRSGIKTIYYTDWQGQVCKLSI